MQKLTIQEEEIMQTVWKTGSGSVKDFMSNLENGDTTPYTTIASIVKNLEKKGYVTSRKYGNVNVYTPIISINDYKREFMGGVIKDYFTNSYRDMVAFFVEEKRISKEELKDLIKLIEESN